MVDNRWSLSYNIWIELLALLLQSMIGSSSGKSWVWSHFNKWTEGARVIVSERFAGLLRLLFKAKIGLVK